MASFAEHQGIILPNTPICLVDGSWSCRKVSRKASISAPHTNMLHEDISADHSAVTATMPHWFVSPQQSDRARVNDGPAQRSGSAVATKPFEFVNVVRPDCAQNPEVRKLIRRHVKIGIKRGPNIKKWSRAVPVVSVVSGTSSDDSTSTSTTESHLRTDQSSPSLPLYVIDNTLPFFCNKSFSKLVGPQPHLLLNYYFNVIAPAWYPLEAHLTYNPVRIGWFSLAVKDDLLFLSIMFSSSSHLALTKGCGDYKESQVMVASILRRLNERLKENLMPSDSTISIVSCLAMVEMSSGNYDKWKLHMSAIQEMVRLRGGISKIGAFVQTKIIRADVEGASDTLAIPYLPSLPKSPVSVLSSLQGFSSSSTMLRNELLAIMQNGGVFLSLQQVILDLNRLAQGLSKSICSGRISIDPRSLDEHLVRIHHDLLHLITTSLVNRPALSANDMDRTMEFNEATCIATLLCAKTINRRIFSSPHSRAVIHRLAGSLALIHEILSFRGYVDVHISEARFAFLLWIYFMGGMAASADEMDFFTDGVSYLFSHARHSSGIGIGGHLRYQSWEEVKSLLSKIVWLPLVHDEPGKAIWELVMAGGLA